MAINQRRNQLICGVNAGIRVYDLDEGEFSYVNVTVLIINSAVKSLRIWGLMFGISVQASELWSSSIFGTTFSKPVKTQKSHIKPCHFIENIAKI